MTQLFHLKRELNEPGGSWAHLLFCERENNTSQIKQKTIKGKDERVYYFCERRTEVKIFKPSEENTTEPEEEEPEEAENWNTKSLKLVSC